MQFEVSLLGGCIGFVVRKYMKQNLDLVLCRFLIMLVKLSSVRHQFVNTEALNDTNCPL